LKGEDMSKIKKRNKLNQWFSENFKIAHELSSKLGVGDPAVRTWLRGQGAPSSHMILKIVELSKGQLTCDDVLRCSLENVSKE